MLVTGSQRIGILSNKTHFSLMPAFSGVLWCSVKHGTELVIHKCADPVLKSAFCQRPYMQNYVVRCPQLRQPEKQCSLHVRYIILDTLLYAHNTMHF